MYYVALYYVKNSFDAEDVTHDAFINLNRNLSSIGDVDSYKTSVYLIKTVKNLSLNFLRRKSGKNFVPIDELQLEAKASTALEQVEMNEDVRIALEEIYRLPELYSDVLTLYYLLELKPKQIAVAFHRNLNTVKAQLTRGKWLLLTNIDLRKQNYEKK